MGTKERRQRDIAEREQRFLDAARDLIRSDGLLNLQMSKVAERCEYAVGTLYQHFASKEDLLLAIVTANTHHRLEAFERLAQWKAPTRDRMFGVAVADVWLVRRLPELFRLEQYVFTEVVWGAASAQRRQEALDAGEPIGRLVEAIVAEAVKLGDLDPRGLQGTELSMAPWALSEGTHMMAHAEGLMEKYGLRDPYRLMLRHQQSLLNGLGWKPLFDVADEAALDRKIETLCSEAFNGLLCDKQK